MFDINLGFDEDKTLTHLTNPKNIHDAEKFCKIYPNGSLYDLDTDQKIGWFCNSVWSSGVYELFCFPYSFQIVCVQ